ncbi:hypothetical protein CALCODRAFT_487442 [Calocera cornea HHB12733]|uniref:Uncharacterized protein n=1 Tax=Calocera cornea HHB12733 TaxID=1353952 RepID=A0A165D4L2_9BASI|nr:hypothetical protein CALCODRAFT_487442 [Calocera cornea HHB12733]
MSAHTLRPLNASEACRDVINLVNARIAKENMNLPDAEMRQVVPLVTNARCGIGRCNRNLVVVPSFNRAGRRSENFGRLYTRCGLHKDSQPCTWHCEPLHPDDIAALEGKWAHRQTQWGKSPASTPQHPKKARTTEKGKGKEGEKTARTWLPCPRKGCTGRAAAMCGKGWCKKCCLSTEVCLAQNAKVGCHLHGLRAQLEVKASDASDSEVLPELEQVLEEAGMTRPAGGGREMREMGMREMKREADDLWTGRAEGSGGGERQVLATQPSISKPSQSFHGPQRRELYQEMDEEWAASFESLQKAREEAREREALMQRMFTLVLVTKNGKHIFPSMKATASSSGLSTQVDEWDSRVEDDLKAELGDSFTGLRGIRLFNPDEDCWSTYLPDTIRKVKKDERVLGRMPGVPDNNTDLAEEVKKITASNVVNERRGAKRRRAVSPPSAPCSPVSSPFPGQGEEAESDDELPLPRADPTPPRQRPVVVIDLTGTTPSRRPAEVPTQRGRQSTLLEQLDKGSPRTEDPWKDWPGTRTYQEIKSETEEIEKKRRGQNMSWRDAFRAVYGFEGVYVTWRQNVLLLQTEDTRELRRRFDRTSGGLWTTFRREGNNIVAHARAAREQEGGESAGT